MRELDPLLLRALSAGRTDRPASDRGRARTLAALGVDAAAASSSEPPPPPPSGVHLAGVARRWLAWPWWAVLALVFTTGESVRSREHAPEAIVQGVPSTPLTVVPDVAPAPPSSATVAVPPASLDVATLGEAPALAHRAVATASENSARRAKAPGDAKMAVARPDRASSQPPRGPSLREEIDALEPATRALAERRCSDARRSVASYRAAFPNGRLEREADVLEIEISGREGRTELARTAAERFVARFPGSPYVLRLAPWLRAHGEDVSSVIVSCMDTAP